MVFTLIVLCLAVNTMLLYEKKLYDQLNEIGVPYTDAVNWAVAASCL